MSRPGRDRALFWTMAVACFTAVLASLGARALDRMAAETLDASDRYMIVRLAETNEADAMSAALRALGAEAQIERVEILSPARAATLLGVDADDPAAVEALAALNLIEITKTAESAIEAADIDAMMREAGVAAETIAPPADSAGAAQAERMRRAALWAALSLSGVMALIVALAARALAGRRRERMVVMADLGATRRDACLPLADEAGAAGFLAGVLGALAAASAALAFVLALAPEPGGAAIASMLRPADYATLLAAPFVAALAAGTGARIGAETLYARAARLR